MSGAVVGLSDMHYALLTKDDDTGVTYGPVTAISKQAVSAKISPKTNSATLYADDGPIDTSSTIGEVDVTIQLADLPMEVRAALLGHTMGDDGVILEKTTDVAPYVAFGFRSRKSNGKYRYVWLLKGQFAPPEDDYQTQNGQTSYQQPSITGTFVMRAYDSAYQAIADEDTALFTTGSTWFTTVPGGTSGTTGT